MKNALLALALFAFVGSASAHDGKDGKGPGKKGKEACSAEAKSHCSKDMAGGLGSTPSCCMKKGAKTAAVKTETKTTSTTVKSM